MEIKTAQRYCDDHLVACCMEVLDWKKTGILHGDHLRTLAVHFQDCEPSGLPLAEEMALTDVLVLAEEMVKVTAMRLVVSQSAKAVHKA